MEQNDTEQIQQVQPVQVIAYAIETEEPVIEIEHPERRRMFNFEGINCFSDRNRNLLEFSKQELDFLLP